MLIMKEIRPYDPPFPSESQVVLSWRAAPNWRNAGPRRLPVKFVRFAVPKKTLKSAGLSLCDSWCLPSRVREPKNQTQEDFAIFCPLGFFKKLKLKMARSWQKFEGAGFDKIFITDHRRESFAVASNTSPFVLWFFMHSFSIHSKIGKKGRVVEDCFGDLGFCSHATTTFSVEMKPQYFSIPKSEQTDDVDVSRLGTTNSLDIPCN